MIPLAAHKLKFLNFSEQEEPFIIKLYEDKMLPVPLRKAGAYIITDDDIPDHYSCYICFDKKQAEKIIEQSKRAVCLDDNYKHLSNGDVVRINPANKSMRILYRRNSEHNSFLVTERCNHYCLMCSQPPKKIDDSWIVNEILETIPLIDPETKEIGFTGGEPTLLEDDFLRILQKCKNYLPNSAVHILSNGRKFADIDYAVKYSQIDHPDMMLGIPLYSDVSHIHDYVVQADNAFDETIRGILNLKKLRQKVEIRIVIHKQTYKRLPQLAEFLARNLLFVDHVALMGLEIMGFTKANMDDLWIDMHDYQHELVVATKRLASAGINVSIYNHQLCVLDKSIWPYARKSISDWKNDYLAECEMCAKQDQCGGFFSSQLLKPSNYIKAFDD